MSDLYGTSHISSIEEIANSTELLEKFLVDDILKGSSDDIHQFCESEEAQILVEKQVLNKPTLHRMSKADDFKRRITIASYQLAKDANDPLWKKLCKFHTLKKEMKKKILAKYSKKATRIARIAQKKYIKAAKSVKATAAEMKAQAATK